MSAWTDTPLENESDAQGQMAESCKFCGRPNSAHYKRGNPAWIDCRTAPTVVITKATAANTCGRCGGKGFIRAFSHVQGGRCLKCEGTGVAG